jgi:hypothetical protein
VLGQVLLLLGGTALDSFVHFATLGARSQAWHEGRAGQWYARAVEEKGQGLNLPRGLVPALFATTRCFTVAVGAVLLTTAAAQLGLGVLAWGPGLLLLGWAGTRLWRRRAAYDRHFYHTATFYAEVLGGGTVAAAPRPFQRALQSVGDWIGTRTFINLRWFGPHIGSLGLVVLFGTTYGLAWVGTWAAVHVALSVGAAAAVTLAAEGPTRTAA